MIFGDGSDCNTSVVANQTRWKHTLNQIKRVFKHNFKISPSRSRTGALFGCRLPGCDTWKSCCFFNLWPPTLVLFFAGATLRSSVRHLLQSGLFLRSQFPNLFLPLTSRPDLQKFGEASFPNFLMAKSSFRVALMRWSADPKNQRMMTRE